MSSVKIQGNASGTGEFTLASPNGNTNRTITLPDATTTIVGTDATQTLTNKTIQGGAITSATAQASTSGTSIDFTGIPSWVKRVTVMFSGVSTNGTSAPWLVQIGPSGGAETTGYLGATTSATTGVGSANSTTGFAINADNSASSLVYGNMTIVNITGSTWVASGTFGQSDRAYSIMMGANKTITGTLSVVRVTTTGGTNTFDAGTINILYEG